MNRSTAKLMLGRGDKLFSRCEKAVFGYDFLLNVFHGNEWMVNNNSSCANESTSLQLCSVISSRIYTSYSLLTFNLYKMILTGYLLDISSIHGEMVIRLMRWIYCKINKINDSFACRVKSSHSHSQL